MEPSIKTIPRTELIGMSIQMNFLANRTQELWQRFMPRRKEIANSTETKLYSVEIYPDLAFFEHFNPATEFEKWAAVRVSDFHSIPGSMEKLTLPAGLYAVFPYKGAASDAAKMYQYIFENWIPGSIYSLDHRPHFALMGEKYKHNDPDSEEEFWVPIKPKSAQD